MTGLDPSAVLEMVITYDRGTHTLVEVLLVHESGGVSRLLPKIRGHVGYALRDLERRIDLRLIDAQVVEIRMVGEYDDGIAT